MLLPEPGSDVPLDRYPPIKIDRGVFLTKSMPADPPEPPVEPDPAPAPQSELEMMSQRVLEAEAQGKAVVMRNPRIRLRPPKKPTSSW
jgi:hypothetical protein